MEAKTKFRLKKQIKTYLTIAWSMLGFFVFYTVLIICSNTLFGQSLAGVLAKIFGTAINAPVILIVAITILVLPLFGGLMFTMLSQSNRQQLHSYKNAIRLYRIRKTGMQIMELIQAGNIDGAIDIYKKFDLGYDRCLDDYIFGMLLGSCKFSGDEKLLKIFERKINAIKELYNPDKIQL
jgi:hypothetical protein